MNLHITNSFFIASCLAGEIKCIKGEDIFFFDDNLFVGRSIIDFDHYQEIRQGSFCDADENLGNLNGLIKLKDFVASESYCCIYIWDDLSRAYTLLKSVIAYVLSINKIDLPVYEVSVIEEGLGIDFSNYTFDEYLSKNSREICALELDDYSLFWKLFCADSREEQNRIAKNNPILRKFQEAFDGFVSERGIVFYDDLLMSKSKGISRNFVIGKVLTDSEIASYKFSDCFLNKRLDKLVSLDLIQQKEGLCFVNNEIELTPIILSKLKEGLWLGGREL